jgi:uncharacterized membrane protein YdfJ with MMPL/SSD domain
VAAVAGVLDRTCRPQKSRRTIDVRLKFGRWILVLWAVAALLGIAGWSNLSSRLSGTGEAPHSQSHTVAEIVGRRFGEAPEGSFLVAYEASASRWGSKRFVSEVEASVRRAARAAAGRHLPLQSVSPQLTFASLPTEFSRAEATARVPAIEHAVGQVPGARIEVTGFPIVAEDLNSTIAHDLRRAEAVSIPVTALILLLLFGSLPAVAVPLLFAFGTISVAMGLVWIEAGLAEIPVYSTSVVTLVGIALAIDYSMLYVSRYREETRRQAGKAPALDVTARTAGRALAISGLVVAAGLFPLVFIPIPFFSGLGLAAVGIPLVSVLAAATLLPALLELFGPHLDRLSVSLPRRLRPASGERAPSVRLATAVTRRPIVSAVAAGSLMVLVALPALGLSITGGSAEILALAGRPSQSARGGQGAALAPVEVLIDGRRGDGAWDPATLRAERSLVERLAADRGVATIQAPSELLRGRRVTAKAKRRARQLGLVDATGRFARVRVISRLESGSPPADALIERLRHAYIPAAGFGRRAVRVGGVAAQDHDFVAAIVDSVPSFALLLVAIMLILLVVLLRSVVLPLKAILMSALSVAGAYGVLVLVFQLGWGTAIGLGPGERVVAWVPVLLFAALLGISTDYEIFMVTRMREEWVRSGDTRTAVRVGLSRISGVVTASALVMIVIFVGFTTSRVVALQQFGVGLVAGVFLDATVIRLVLVPSLMVLFGRWNWTYFATGPKPRRPAVPSTTDRQPFTPDDSGG